MGLTDQEKNRYSRHILLSEIGYIGQEKLQKAKVLIIGAGGLGCPVLQYLAAAGVGKIGVVDFDVVEESNLQRQILFTHLSLGRNKAIVAKEKATELNPHICIEAYPEGLNQHNAITLFKDYDIIVDATDNYESRYLINDASILTKKPIAFASIYKYEGQISVFNYKDGPSYRCLFPESPVENNNCSQVGVLGVLAGIVGSLQANEVIKLILHIGQPLSGKIMLINTLTNQTRLIDLKKKEHTPFSIKEFNKRDFSTPCNLIKEIKPKELLERLKNGQKIQFVDVRSKNEQPKIKILEQLKIPLSDIQKETFTVVYCQSGTRSRQALLSLQKTAHYSNAYNLKGGIFAWVSELPNTKTEHYVNRNTHKKKKNTIC